MTVAKPYNSALLFTGGGLHCGYYLGLYQALCEHGKRPDVVIASCGGSLVASLIASTPDIHAACNLFLSRDYHEMINQLKTNKAKTPFTYTLPAIKRYLNFHNKKAKTYLDIKDIDQLTTLSLINMDIRALKQFYDNKNCHQTAVIIVASHLTFNNQLPDKWQTLLWSSQQSLTNHLLTLNPKNPLAMLSPSTIDERHYITDDLPMSVAVRASIADMYYLPPFSWCTNVQKLLLSGGVLNLTPIELATTLANTVYAEHKADYDNKLAEPAIFHTFGFRANERLQTVRHILNNNPNIHTVNTANYRKHINPLIGKKWHWQGHLKAQYLSFDHYKSTAQKQIDYGYQQMTKLLKSKDNL